MNKLKTVAYILIAVLILSIGINIFQYSQNLSLNKEKDDADTRLEMSSLLTQLQFQANAKLEELDRDLVSACTQISAVGLNSSEARTILLDLAANNSLIINAGTAYTDDVLVAVEPSQYSSIEGIDIKDQEQNIRLHATLRPAMSNIIPLVEGFDGVVMVAPTFDANDAFKGTLSIVIEPYLLLNASIAPALKDTTYACTAIQLDGLSIFDSDPAQVGKNLFTDLMFANYTELLALGHRVVAESAGYGTYKYSLSEVSGQVVQKECYWTTIGTYGTEWRIVIIHVLNA
jgi:hypothetical protein